MWRVLCVFTATLVSCSEDFQTDDRFVMGKSKYEAISRESRMPRYSKCWTAALSNLQQGCKQLTDDMQYRMALAFTNCHLEKTGRTTYPCDAEDDLKDCLFRMDSDAYQVHAEFVTHTQNICFFLEAQKWHEDTEHTIERLADNSETVAQQIEDSSNLQAELLKRQNDSIRNQQVLLEKGNELKSSLEQSSVDVHKMLIEFKDTTAEQRAMIFEVFDRLTSLQKVVMGEFTGFYSLIFYTVSILISYLITSTPRVSGARFWLFVIMTGNILCERLIVYIGAQDNTLSEGQILDASAVLYNRLWWCRKTFSVIAILTWLWVAYRFQDLNRINNALLCDIKKQNSELKHILTAYQSSPQPAVNQIGYGMSFDMPDGVHKSLALTKYDSEETVVDCVHSTTEGKNQRSQLVRVEGYESGSESDSSSGSSAMTDRTFQYESDESDVSFMTTGSSHFSRESTPLLLDELHDLRQATPLREMTPFMGEGDSTLSDSTCFTPPEPGRTPGRRRGRPPGPRPRPQPGPFIPQVRYNLRNRRQNVPAENPMVRQESAEDFGRAVKHLANIAMRNARKTHYTITKVHDTGNDSSFYSGGSS